MTPRLGGMALGNGVLVHGPTAWACAVRLPGGELKVVARRKAFRAADVANPVARGPARLAEALALLPQVKRALPEAQLPFQRRAVVVAMAVSTVAGSVLRRSRLRATTQEVLAGLLAVTPAVLALRGGELAAYHGAEHVAIGSFEHGEPRPREHERCGSHLLGPMLLSGAAANLVARRLPAAGVRAGRAVGAVGAVVVSTELFGWMTRNPERRLARALARPGHELQHRFATAEPSGDQLEVADAALRACFGLEREASGGGL